MAYPPSERLAFAGQPVPLNGRCGIGWTRGKGGEFTECEEEANLLGQRHAWARPGENVSIYLGTRSRRINGSGAGNLNHCVCRPRPPRILAAERDGADRSLRQRSTSIAVFLQTDRDGIAIIQRRCENWHCRIETCKNKEEINIFLMIIIKLIIIILIF